MDFESISLAARTHCLDSAAVLRPIPVKDKASTPASAGVEVQKVQSRAPQPWVCLLCKMFCRCEVCCRSQQPRACPFLFLLSLLESSGKRQRGDSNPCGQSPMDFESISLTARTHCLGESLKESLELMSTSRWTHLRRGPEAARVLGYWGGSDSEGIQTPAGRAQWISSPSP